jgi:polygalacturonase
MIRNLTYDAIELYSVSDVRIEGNHFENVINALHFGRGHDDAGDVANIVISNNTFTNAGSVIEYVRDTVFEHNSFQKSPIVCRFCHRVTFRANCFSHSQEDAVVTESSTDIVFEDNDFLCGPLASASTVRFSAVMTCVLVMLSSVALI